MTEQEIEDHLDNFEVPDLKSTIAELFRFKTSWDDQMNRSEAQIEPFSWWGIRNYRRTFYGFLKICWNVFQRLMKEFRNRDDYLDFSEEIIFRAIIDNHIIGSNKKAWTVIRRTVLFYFRGNISETPFETLREWTLSYFKGIYSRSTILKNLRDFWDSGEARLSPEAIEAMEIERDLNFYREQKEHMQKTIRLIGEEIQILREKHLPTDKSEQQLEYFKHELEEYKEKLKSLTA